MEIEKIRELAIDILERRIVGPEGGPNPDIVKFLLEMQVTYRFYMLDREAVNILWSRIRNDGAVLHFIMGSTSEFLARLPDESVYKSLCDRFAWAAGQSTSQSNSVIDADTQDRLGKRDKLKALLNDNQWLLFILVLDTVNDVLSAFAGNKR